MLLAKNWPFFQVFILGNIGQENVFYNVIERENGFLRYKKKKFKKSKNWVFPKGLVHAFGQKLAFFQIFSLGNIRQEKVFYDIG